jgi:hypothetical protein
VDLAENYKTQDQTITAGDVVAIDANNDESIIKATPNSLVVGIVSTKPGVLLGLSDDETVRPVALVGRVPVKVNSENGNINRGDKLTISSIAGVATKFNGIGPVVGIAYQLVACLYTQRIDIMVLIGILAPLLTR